ncbi:MAG: tRNA uridine-5-carboxymethylaminomethyl(34) synthesis GTPase MnmE [Lachnospiraceae bacterium]|nr:tRNA uridine-5-carboxymethylaminomethyl(34) synthesis GTPase MnmE [Lachnospiraceae bacterium]
MNTNETIAAIATSLSESGISIIRVSGPDAFSIGDRIFKGKDGKKVSEYKSHTIHYGFICFNDEITDEVILSVMKAPKSYTTEDTIEINCHGGVMMTKKILDIVLRNGARLALPGEFTKRAFLNGRIDLTKAEAIMDIIEADNDLALRASIKQLRGDIYEKVKDLREKILFNTAFIESALDDPEHINIDGFSDKLFKETDLMISDLKKMEESAKDGQIIKNGILTVIVGKPNAGKSSFLNMLIGKEKAIVTEIAGTTRDALEQHVRIGDVSLNIVDTAGIRTTDDVVEKIGVEISKNYITDADIVLYVVDSSVKLDENDKNIIELIKNKKVIILYNKSDLESVIDENEILTLFEHDKNVKMIKISAKEGFGLEEFEDTIKDFVFSNSISSNEELIITNMRHKEKIHEAIDSLNLVITSIENNMPEDFLTIDLMSAYESLGEIIGEHISDDLADQIFSKFCMGK